MAGCIGTAGLVGVSSERLRERSPRNSEATV